MSARWKRQAQAPSAVSRSTNERRQHVDGDAAGAEFQPAVARAGAGEVLGHVGVLDHRDLAVHHAEVAQLLHGVALGQDLGGHLRLPQVVQAEEHRVEAPHQRVVHLEVADEFHAAPGHVVQRRRWPARPAGCRRARWGSGPTRPCAASRSLPPKPMAGIVPCTRKNTSLGFRPKKLLLAEERPRDHVVGRGGHDVPGDGHPGRWRRPGSARRKPGTAACG